MAQIISEKMERDIEAKLRQMMDNPEVKISRVANQWWELKNEKGELLVTLYDEPTYGDNANLVFFEKYRYSLTIDVAKRLLKYAEKASYEHRVREYVDEVNNVLEEINKYGQNPNFEGYKIMAPNQEAIERSVEKVAMNLIHNPSNPVEDIIIGGQIIDIQNEAGKVLIHINLRPYGNKPNVKLMGERETEVRLGLDVIERIQQAIFTEMNLRRIRSATDGLQRITDALTPYTTPAKDQLQDITDALLPYTTPHSNNSAGRR